MIKAKKVTFFTEPKWAFGAIHHALCKILHPHIDGEVLNFYEQYSQTEMQWIDANTDLWVTNWPSLLIKNYHINPKKVCFVAHAEWDLYTTARDLYGCTIGSTNTALFDGFAKFGVISDHLKDKATSMNVRGVPKVARLGIFHDRYTDHANPVIPEKLKRVAVMGAHQSENFFGKEIKRGHLVFSALKESGLDMEFVMFPRTHYLAMPSKYWSVDAVVMASTEEGGGLPMIEGAAAGRLCIGTPVGYFKDASYGVTLPIDEESFKKELVNTLKKYSEQRGAFKQECFLGRQETMEWDWSHRVDEWLQLLL